MAWASKPNAFTDEVHSSTSARGPGTPECMDGREGGDGVAVVVDGLEEGRQHCRGRPPRRAPWPSSHRAQQGRCAARRGSWARAGRARGPTRPAGPVSRGLVNTTRSRATGRASMLRGRAASIDHPWFALPASFRQLAASPPRWRSDGALELRGPRYVARPSSRRVSVRGMARSSGPTSTVAGWLMKSTASGLRGGSGRKRIGQAASLMSGAGPGRSGRVRCRPRRGPGAGRPASTSSSGPPTSKICSTAASCSRRVGGERATSPTKTGASCWRPRLVSGHEGQGPREGQETVQRDVARAVDPGRPDDGPGHARAAHGVLGDGLGAEPVPSASWRRRRRRCRRRGDTGLAGRPR